MLFRKRRNHPPFPTSAYTTPKAPQTKWSRSPKLLLPVLPKNIEEWWSEKLELKPNILIRRAPLLAFIDSRQSRTGDFPIELAGILRPHEENAEQGWLTVCCGIACSKIFGLFSRHLPVGVLCALFSVIIGEGGREHEKNMSVV